MSDDICPLIPMGAIVGRPTPEEIRKHLSKFRSVGVEQYLLYPRSGCELEYMSDEWLDCCAMYIKEAKALGYKALWLYDEFNWPSGQCGGRVQAANPDFALQILFAEPHGDGYNF
ncbi:MAG: hypothetical protein LBM70_01340 [Victivallales bacterium]|jgi:hypothetical protein|nr:hypothetical protein [Victivallales bacterium]